MSPCLVMYPGEHFVLSNVLRNCTRRISFRNITIAVRRWFHVQKTVCSWACSLATALLVLQTQELAVRPSLPSATCGTVLTTVSLWMYFKGDWKRMAEFERLLLFRALRPDRLTAAMAKFVTNTIGKAYVTSNPFDLEVSFQVTSNH